MLGSEGTFRGTVMNAPARIPPSGHFSNFVNPETRAPMGVIITSLLMAIMILFVTLRVIVKALITKNFGMDDLTSILAGLFGTGVSAMSLSLMKNPGVGPHMYDIPITVFHNQAFTDVSESTTISSFHRLLYKFSSIKLDSEAQKLVTIQALYPVAICFAKISLFLLILTIFGPHNRTRILVYIGAIFCTSFYMLSLILFMIFCAPRPVLLRVEKSEEIMPNKTTAVEPAGRFNCQKLGQWLYSTRANLQSLILSVLGLIYKIQAQIHSPHVTEYSTIEKAYRANDDGRVLKRSLRLDECTLDSNGEPFVSPSVLDRLKNEAACMFFIRKHNAIPVPKILDIHEVDGSYHLWMEFIDGVEMSELTEEEETEVLPQGNLHMSSKTH
jgi:hypothetical protein